VTDYIPRWLTGSRSQMVIHSSSNLPVHSWESDLRSFEHTSDTLTTTLSSHLSLMHVHARVIY